MTQLLGELYCEVVLSAVPQQCSECCLLRMLSHKIAMRGPWPCATMSMKQFTCLISNYLSVSLLQKPVNSVIADEL